MTTLSEEDFLEWLKRSKKDVLERFKQEMEAEYNLYMADLIGRTATLKQHVEEVWVGLDLLPNYEVSNYGRVFNIKTNKELKPTPDGKGFLKVALYHHGVRKDVYVHRMVAKAFFLNYREGHEVKHISENHQDNTVLNLTLSDRPCRQSEDMLW